MTTRLNPYLSFRDTAKDAMKFYRTVFGGELSVSTFGFLLMGATPGVPLEKAPWGDTFGMLTDKFGIGWMVNIAGS